MKDKVNMKQILTSCPTGLINVMATPFQLMGIKFTSLAEGTITFPAILFTFLTQKPINGADLGLQGTFQHLVTAIRPALSMIICISSVDTKKQTIDLVLMYTGKWKNKYFVTTSLPI